MMLFYKTPFVVSEQYIFIYPRFVTCYGVIIIIYRDFFNLLVTKPVDLKSTTVNPRIDRARQYKC